MLLILSVPNGVASSLAPLKCLTRRTSKGLVTYLLTYLVSKDKGRQ